ncbi:MAG: type III-B CRISPR module RAMP protein Cmr6, partial [Rhodocyclaceae bacterium]
GREPPAGDSNAVRGALSFWDVIPQIKGNSLMVEIMTPHQSHYYQEEKQDEKSGTIVSPHDSGQPNPISFLTVPPGAGFTFHVVCDRKHLERLTRDRFDGAPDLLAQEHWKTLLTAAFEHAFAWLGFGAKTAVGYGAMASEAMRQSRRAQDGVRCEPEAQADGARQQAHAPEQVEIWEGARIKFNRANKSLSVEKGGRQAIALAPKGEALLSALPADMRRKIKTGQFVKVGARVTGGELIEVLP